MQLIKMVDRLCRQHDIPVFLQTYNIVSCSKHTGMVEYVPNSMSLDALKRHDYYAGSLKQHFANTFGGVDSEGYTIAVNEFVRSLAAYSMVCYLFAIKDRYAVRAEHE
jgi:phosphatidylinositol kinase/protein kinase (PI-3  family)